MQSPNVNMVDLVADRIKRSALGELITEEDLYEVVKQGIERAFFKERVDKSGYNHRTLPPLIVETVEAALKKQVAAAVDKWAVEHADKIAPIVQAAAEKGLMQYAETMMTARVQEHMKPVLREFAQSINQERERAGLPRLDFWI